MLFPHVSPVLPSMQKAAEPPNSPFMEPHKDRALSSPSFPCMQWSHEELQGGDRADVVPAGHQASQKPRVLSFAKTVERMTRMCQCFPWSGDGQTLFHRL